VYRLRHELDEYKCKTQFPQTNPQTKWANIRTKLEGGEEVVEKTYSDVPINYVMCPTGDGIPSPQLEKCDKQVKGASENP
jgi:hypothetical protein